nr:hypothetical protein [uncultured Sphingomonas sp.]
MALVTAALAILWLLVAYLLWLGVLALVQPQRALSFLFVFAQTRAANLVEGVSRLVIGLAFLILDGPGGWTPWGMVVGSFLAISAVVLLLAPEYHRRLAPRLVSLVQRFVPLMGLCSLLLAGLLASTLLQVRL